MKFWTGVALLALCGSSALAQNGPVDAVACLDFRSAIATAARIAPAIETANARLDESEAELALARSLFRPQVSTFLRSGIGDAQISDQQINNQVGLRVSQRLFDFGDARYGRQAARAAILAREADVTAARHASAEQVGIDYLGWVETQARLIATEDRVAYFARQSEAIATLLPQGGATVADRAAIEAELAEARSAKLELTLILRRFATRIALGTRLPVPPCAVPDASAIFETNDVVLTRSDDLIREGLANNPRLASRRSVALNLAALSRREASARFPVISATGISSYASSDFETLGRLRNRIGVDVSVPIYTGRAQAAREAAAAARTREARGQIAELEREIEEDIRIALAHIEIRQEQLLRRDLAVGFKATQLDAADRQFEARLITMPELIRIRIEYEAAELAAIETEFDLRREELRVLVLSGRVATLSDSAIK